ncbi:MAG: hypothetical protein ABH834_05275 [Candidatus Altiarchaeota archaeon]
MNATKMFPKPDFSAGPSRKQIVEDAFKPLDALIVSENRRISAERSEFLSSGVFEEESVDEKFMQEK